MTLASRCKIEERGQDETVSIDFLTAETGGARSTRRRATDQRPSALARRG
jgi:hypothetical protein